MKRFVRYARNYWTLPNSFHLDCLVYPISTTTVCLKIKSSTTSRVRVTITITYTSRDRLVIAMTSSERNLTKPQSQLRLEPYLEAQLQIPGES